jgi:hypothetical protein
VAGRQQELARLVNRSGGGANLVDELGEINAIDLPADRAVALTEAQRAGGRLNLFKLLAESRTGAVAAPRTRY